jgi:hypothetical protein
MIEKRRCVYAECGEGFVSNNPRKKYCSLTCKNKAAYAYKQTFYEWEDQMSKARRSNIKILEYLYSQKNITLTKKQLETMGFDFSAAYIPDKNKEQQRVYQFGNIALCVVSDYNYLIHKI